MKRLWLALILWSLIAVPAFAGPITIAIKEEAVVKGSLITLGEIADITGTDPNRIEGLRELKLGSAPPPGTSLMLTQRLLGIRLAGTGADFSEVTWQTPPVVTVTSGSQTVRGEELAAVVKRSLMTKLVGDGEVTLDILAIPADLQVPLGAIQYTIGIPGGVRFAGPTATYVTINVDGRRFHSVLVRAEVKRYQQVVVAARPIDAQEIITSEALRLERMDTGRLASYITDGNQVLGLASRRSVAIGTPITSSMVVKPILIKRGALVTIVARMGDIEVTAAGQALQDGAHGQLIRVQNMNSKRMIAAQVVDASTVLVGTYMGK